MNHFIHKKKASIILYHNPDPQYFKMHITFLNRYFNFIPLDLLVTAIKNKNWTNIPNKAMVITFDDGHKDNYKLFNVFKEFKLKPIIYCCSDIIGTYRHYWWDQIDYKKVEMLKKKNNSERLELLKKYYKHENSKDYDDRQALNWTELNELAEYITIGSHTKYHPILTCCSHSEMKEEIIDSKLNIEKNINVECKHFAYPNGDYDSQVLDYVKNAGYESARTIDVGWNGIHSDPYRLKITGITDNASINLLIAQLTGLTMFMRYLSKGSIRGLHRKITANK